ncbi:MAG TPA: sigma-54 dependent transcriptional regulator, partial [Candidatus Hydrogenedens sp.]|nr:sigma-54 dependent transcriptional regulator [Candidatus Hydrogenedens sp.]
VIAPIALGKEIIGAFVISADTPHRFYEEADLEYLLAMAHTLAPYIRAAERMQQLEWENQQLIAGGLNFDPLIGNSKAIQKVRALARDCARSDLCVLILGETGTGKELVARLIHNLSHRAQKKLVVVNCAAIPDELFESELFGHEKGAFTGAHTTKIGLMEEADNGTLFLDEIGDLSLSHQARLLRAIETGTFRRVGGNTDIHVNVRVLCATNKDLPAEVNAGRFRRDLFHRLNAFVITIPPLRERRDDIPILADYFLQQVRRRFPVRPKQFSPQALKWLDSQPWYGNVRELRNLIERSAVVARADIIQPQDLATELKEYTTEKFLTLEEMEKEHIIKALQRCQGNVVSSAELLGIGKSTLYRKIAEYQINPSAYINGK